MTRNELNSIFATYVKNHLSPKQWERDDVSQKYDDLCGFLGGNCIQSGSYARYTSTTPVNDLDVIWTIPKDFISGSIIEKSGGRVDPNHLDPSAILKSLAKHLEDAYKNADQQVRIEAQSHSVGVYFGTDDEFSMDIVPAIVTGEKNIYDDDIYWVPQIAALSKTRRAQTYAKHEAIDWIKSDPRGYIEDARELNEDNPNFRKVAKFVRKWRRECKKHDDTFPLKSFHIELIVNHIFCETEGIDTFGGVKEFFLKLPYYLNTPTFVDRADASRYVDSYIASITENDRAKIIARVNAVNTTIAAIEMTGSSHLVTPLIKNVLSSTQPPIGALTVHKAPNLLALGDFSHKAELEDVNIVDHGTYPCSVEIKAQLWFRGPRDRKINRKPRSQIRSKSIIPTWHEIDYTAITDAPVPYRVYWQV
ncbi:MAG: SMODS domain-containing nucleotidyltransferase [Minisyncoccota bacterium]